MAPNLTPDRETGIGDWTDDMLARAIREGVAHDGHLLDPTIMPYEFYRSMSDEDLASIIVYLRSLPAIPNALPPMKPRKDVVAPYAIPIYAPVPQPDVSTPVKRGAYLVQLGACQWCHTLRDENRVPACTHCKSRLLSAQPNQTHCRQRTWKVQVQRPNCLVFVITNDKHCVKLCDLQ